MVSELDETLAAWATRTVLTLNAVGWLEVQAVLDYIDTTKPNIIGYSVSGDWASGPGPWACPERAVALRNRRDNVDAGVPIPPDLNAAPPEAASPRMVWALVAPDRESPPGYHEPFQIPADQPHDPEAWYIWPDGYDSKASAIKAQHAHKRAVLASAPTPDSPPVGGERARLLEWLGESASAADDQSRQDGVVTEYRIRHRGRRDAFQGVTTYVQGLAGTEVDRARVPEWELAIRADIDTVLQTAREYGCRNGAFQDALDRLDAGPVWYVRVFTGEPATPEPPAMTAEAELQVWRESTGGAWEDVADIEVELGRRSLSVPATPDPRTCPGMKEKCRMDGCQDNWEWCARAGCQLAEPPEPPTRTSTRGARDEAMRGSPGTSPDDGLADADGSSALSKNGWTRSPEDCDHRHRAPAGASPDSCPECGTAAPELPGVGQSGRKVASAREALDDATSLSAWQRWARGLVCPDGGTTDANMRAAIAGQLPQHECVEHGARDCRECCPVADDWRHVVPVSEEPGPVVGAREPQAAMGPARSAVRLLRAYFKDVPRPARDAYMKRLEDIDRALHGLAQTDTEPSVMQAMHDGGPPPGCSVSQCRSDGYRVCLESSGEQVSYGRSEAAAIAGAWRARADTAKDWGFDLVPADTELPEHGRARPTDIGPDSTSVTLTSTQLQGLIAEHVSNATDAYKSRLELASTMVTGMMKAEPPAQPGDTELPEGVRLPDRVTCIVLWEAAKALVELDWDGVIVRYPGAGDINYNTVKDAVEDARAVLSRTTAKDSPDGSGQGKGARTDESAPPSQETSGGRRDI